MAYSAKIYEKATAELQSRREKAESQAKKRHDELALRYPELVMLENEMSKAGLEVIKVIGMGADAKGFIEKLKKRNLEVQNEIKELLRTAGLPEDYLEPRYLCNICEDKGVDKDRLCSCHIELLKRLAFESLCKTSPLKISSFDSFNLSYYPDTISGNEGVSCRQKMKDILDYCKTYANYFDMDSVSIFMYGETGLGKTHLSLAIAGEVIKKGYGVIYGTAQNLLTQLERERFGRAKEDNDTDKMLLQCDLLILDDLGTEFSTQFTVAEIYNIVNTRMLSGRPTIINTNLSMKQLQDKYSQRITSRIIGEYQMLRFSGKDIRQLKD